MQTLKDKIMWFAITVAHIHVGLIPRREKMIKILETVKLCQMSSFDI